jgi:polyisoprenoid-binding protein YceI
MKHLLIAAALLAAQPALAADWTLQPASSTLGFSCTQSSVPFNGTFSTWTAQIAYDPAQPQAAHVHIIIQTASAHTGDPQRDQALPRNDWFSTDTFPQAVFDATGFTPMGGDKFTTTGTLTIRGVTKKLKVTFTLDISGTPATAKGQVNLVRTDYGVGQGNWSSGGFIGLNVGVNFTLVAQSK